MAYDTLLCNSFSINMLNTELIEEVGEKTITFRSITTEKAAELISRAIDIDRFKNVVGHSTSDTLIREELMKVRPDLSGRMPKGKRKTVKLDGGELVVVGQYIGQRLPENAIEQAKELLKDSRLKFWLVIL